MQNVDDLSIFLKKKGFSESHTKVLQASKVDIETFKKLTRDDLKDLFPAPEDFLTRKALFDTMSSLQESGRILIAEDPDETLELFSQSIASTPESTRSSTPLSSRSTLSVESSPEETDQSFREEGCPPLKRTKPRECPEPVKSKKKKCCIGEDFKLPMSKEIKKCIAENQGLDDKTRTKFVRDCITCLQAYIGEERITDDHTTELAQMMCKQVPLLRDKQPPLWPEDVDFSYWASLKYLLRKRVSNQKYAQVKKSNKSSQYEELLSTGDAATDADIQKHEQELIKMLKKKTVDWKSVDQLQTLTFTKRKEEIGNVKGKNAVSTMLDKYPYLDNQKVLLRELELHLSTLNSSQRRTVASQDIFMKQWKALAKCFVNSDQVNDENKELVGLEIIHNEFKGAKPILVTLPAGEDIESYTDNLEGPVLVVHHPSLDGEMTEDEPHDCQVFAVIERDVLCECYKGSETSIFSASLLVLLSMYYVFNLQYNACDKNMFIFLEEHVLGIVPRRKSYAYKAIENKLLSRLNKE